MLFNNLEDDNLEDQDFTLAQEEVKGGMKKINI